ncbi:MAG: hypothetical protein HY791_30485 [Deltaproteobacteria bacterium]|nr:hypothetical protein [Deltaproteobacteria bacterium]
MCSSLTVFCACEPGTSTSSDGGTPSADGGTGFDDHTVPRIDSRQQLSALSAPGPRPEVKFVIAPFFDSPNVLYMDSATYTLHDEWYWFRLLNGHPVPGDPDTQPVTGLSFSTVEEIKLWAKDKTTLPLDLKWVADGRLYSPRFYTLALSGDDRKFGVGKLITVPALSEPIVRPEMFVFELEYQDSLSARALELFFAALRATLPAEIGDALVWAVRSPNQERLFSELLAQGHPLASKIIRYSDLAVPGEVEVYADGITAGRLRVIRAAKPEDLALARSSDVLLTDFIPDYLPPASGLVTSVPQTPLAHIAVLSRNRGIPNAYLGGLFDNPEIDQLERGYAPVILRARSPDELDLMAITEAQLRAYQGLTQKQPIRVDPIDLSGVPYVFDLASYSFDQVEQLRPVIGGKSAGFLALLDAGVVTTPDRPVAISVRAYAEHLRPLEPTITAMLTDPEFDGPRGSAKIRYLCLEGPADYDLRYASAEDKSSREGFLARHPAGDALGDLVRAGGLRASVRAHPMNPATLEVIRAALQAAFSDYSELQGLRFRSSSNVEDIEGFNGAGLYDSNTGFLHPEAQPDPLDRNNSVEFAIKKTWGSYWSFEAFEERRSELVDHTSGGMGVLVHARFDDALESANGVALFTVLPSNHADESVFELNVQDGAVSVTNPTGDSLPEVDRVTKSTDGTLRIERLAASTLVPAGAHVVSDEELRGLFEQTEAVTRLWLSSVNRAAPASHKRSTLTLDFEVRRVRQGWPRLVEGVPQNPARMIVKQARSLEPGLRNATPEVVGLPIPRDVLARARRVERRICTSPTLVVGLVETYTDPLLRPDMGYWAEPLTASIFVRAVQAIAELGWGAGYTIDLDHTQLAHATHPGLGSGEPWSLDVKPVEGSARARDLRRVQLSADFLARVETSSASYATPLNRCTPDLLYSTPRDYLLDILAQATAGH